MKKILLAVIGIMALGLAVQATEVLDTEEVIQGEKCGEEWTLDISFRTPQRIVMAREDGTKEAYWYVVYVVTNRTGQARDFMPVATLFTDGGKLSRDGMYPAVVAEVKRQYRLNELKSSVEMMGPPPEEGQDRQPNLKDGPEEAQQGIFVFRAGDERVNNFRIFVAGLSGEYVIRELPPVKEGESPKSIILRKTLALEYAVPGDETAGQASVNLLNKSWIWR